LAFIEVIDLYKIYKDLETDIEVPALRGIDLAINEGEIVGIIGASGAGKTTLLSIIGGLIPPSAGEVIVNEKTINKLNAKELCKYRQQNAGLLWQLPGDNLLMGVSLLKNVMLPMQITNKPHSYQKKRAKELLERLDLGSRIDHKPTQISGGEATRAGIAVALANEPELILADQITGELDSVTTQETMDYLKELNDEYGTTMFIATHKKQFIDFTDRSFEISDGRIIKILTQIDEYQPSLQISEKQKQEYIFVDKQGFIRLPEEILKQIEVGDLLEAVVEDGMIKLIPVKNSEKKKNSKDEDK
jgi:ABC-type lipoprotein export system ATPase subunit